jgi:hypothetical protein
MQIKFATRPVLRSRFPAFFRHITNPGKLQNPHVKSRNEDLLNIIYLKAQLHWRISARMSASGPADIY